MSHKAYEFDWVAFDRELAPLLYQALATSNVTTLGDFVEANRASCKDLSFGEPLGSGWQEAMESFDVQQVGDLAITRYYDLLGDSGLAESWMDLSGHLPADHADALLGKPFGPSGSFFDPGYQGSYFQEPATVQASCKVLAARQDIQRFLELAARAARNRNGLYVTF